MIDVGQEVGPEKCKQSGEWTGKWGEVRTLFCRFQQTNMLEKELVTKHLVQKQCNTEKCGEWCILKIR